MLQLRWREPAKKADQAEKAKAEEKRVAQQLAQRNSQIAWHRKQRERQKKGLSRGERKQVQARLYAVNKRAPARVYC